MPEVLDPMDLEMQMLSSPPVSRVSSSTSIEKARCEDMDEVVMKFVDANQTVPLLKTVDNRLHSRKQIRTLIHVLRSIVAFKAHAASVASAHVHLGATEVVSSFSSLSLELNFLLMHVGLG
ncbi:hypothetical protein L1987_60470 [Smallanthus sonchifolius]|uniref:Uncharacterized protein n=1 Tax=Smallanthus sonchifolius TaxID=185202 RepID=A0ACB9D8J1_9ASTR|nr:hypothetical protein L1987_60470 [Smallanthus sonchifolius]